MMNSSAHIEMVASGAMSPDPAAATLPWDASRERGARIERRRDFVLLKLRFMQAAADVDGAIGAHLVREVRRSKETEELWRIRAPILCSLPSGDARSEQHRRYLQRDIDSLFALLPAAPPAKDKRRSQSR